MSAQKKVSLVGTLIGILFLVLSLAAGVLLVKSEQDIRNKAAEQKEHKVTICHKTSSDTTPWVQMEVADSAVPAHTEHGDIQGNCPTQDKNDNKDKGNNNSNQNQGSNQNVTHTTNVTVVNQPVPAVNSATSEIRYVYITTKIDFYVKFQGIESKKPNKSVRVIFKSPDELHVYNKVWVASDNKGVYKGTLTDIRPGSYDVFIKGDGYLQKKFSGVTISKGLNRFRWDKEMLLAGDFNDDNIIDANDVANLMSIYTEDFVMVPDNSVYDIDMNTDVDTSDIKIVLGNFNQLKIEGDN